MQKTLGILAHVDAGKTTLCEQILYKTGSIRTCGRVDHQNAFLDTDRLERERGITIFSGQAEFCLGESAWHLVDTPGHADFSAEMERVLAILDYAVLVVSCVEGVQSHTETIWRLLRRYHIPTFFFLNKTDRTGADTLRVVKEIKSRLTDNICGFTGRFTGGVMEQSLAEEIAEREDLLLEEYLESGYEKKRWLSATQTLIREEKLFPCFCGAALRGDGVTAFLDALELLTCTSYDAAAPFGACVYKIRHDTQQNRITCLKVTSGTLHVKDEIGGEKINELRIYNGEKYAAVKEAPAGSLCAVTGLSVRNGAGLGIAPPAPAQEIVPLLSSRVLFDRSIPAQTMQGMLRQLEEEDPLLAVEWQKEIQELHVRVMGTIQLEVLRALVKDRFGAEISFGRCEVLYRETVTDTVIGVGHFEPLRHYAEVHFRLSPGPRGSGITFESACSTDVLDKNWQHLIETNLFEREHRGVLTGAPLTDVHIVLTFGRAHIKHTEGGDFREAVRRAVRQGLMQANCILLEPYYAFSVTVPQAQLGRLISDVQRMCGTTDSPQTNGEMVQISGRAPVSEMMDYATELAAFTHGRGALRLWFDGYDLCHNAEEVVSRIGYDCLRDAENPCGSVFCAHGAGYSVPWDEVKRHISG